MTIAVVSDEGTVTITDAALCQIVVQAAETATGARVRRRRQLEIAIADTGTRVQLELAVPYGQVLPDVARDVQERVAVRARHHVRCERDRRRRDDRGTVVSVGRREARRPLPPRAARCSISGT